MYWLGIDVGTGGTRALLTDRRGSVRLAFTAPHEDIRMEHPLWAEQRPQNWWDAAQQAIRGALAGADISGQEINGVGLSGQMHGLTLLDPEGRVLRPALIWCDQRSQAQVDSINRIAGKDAVLRWTANPALTGFTLPKLLWVREHEGLDRARKFLLPKDYVRFQLTGDYATDVSDASGTALFDVVARRWSCEMFDAMGLDRSLAPECYESAEPTGVVSRAAAAATGLREGTPVIAGAGDQAASAIGNGIVQAGVVSCTIGSSGVVFAHLDRPTYDELGRVHTFCHAAPGAWHVMGVTQGAGLSLQWFRNQLAPGADYDALMTEASQAPPGSHGLFWLPYLMGERTPHLDAAARGGWIGLTAKHTRAEMIRSLIEGVCYSLKDGLDLIAAMGVTVDAVRVSGGGARSPFWRQLLADILGKRIVSLDTQEGSAYGAALLAMVGTGAFASVEEACASAIHEKESIEPRPVESEIYAHGHQTYRSLYPMLQPFYRSTA